MHFAISADFQGSYNDNSKTFRERLHLSSHLVTEDVGTGKEKILIDFRSPAEFGFDAGRLHPKKETVICARVGSPDRGVWGTKMCHYVRAVNEGVEMRSRFWIGHQVQRMGGFAQPFQNSKPACLVGQVLEVLLTKNFIIKILSTGQNLHSKI